MNPSNFESSDWHIRSGVIELGPRFVLVGVLNVTPDSFSDGGLYTDVDSAVIRAREMIDSGVTIIDVGGESTRPDAESVDGATERDRVLPVIDALSKLDVYISVDTYRSETARAAIDLGAHIINDVTGCREDEDIASVVSESGCGLVSMHTNRGFPLTDTDLDSIVSDQRDFFSGTLEILSDRNVSANQIILDPGFGFGKDESHNYGLLCVLERVFGLEFLYGGESRTFKFMVGTSRKRFLGVSGLEFDERGIVTSATSVMSRLSGASLFRVHDIIENRDSLFIADSVIDRFLGDVA